MIIFLYLILVLAWALLIIILKCKKARAKRLAEQDEQAHGPVHVVQIGSNLYDIMSLHRGVGDNYSGVYSCLEHGTIGHHRQRASTSVTHSNSAFIGDDGSIYPAGTGIVTMEPPPSYDEVIRLPAYYPKVETFVPEMVVPPSSLTGPSPTRSAPFGSHRLALVQHDPADLASVVTIPATAPATLPVTDAPTPVALDTNGNRIKSLPPVTYAATPEHTRATNS
ncbi:uncharacterized protein LOC131205552 [Anopheles bellator]|uniref:uncharacterized protein LOC131205552 n=1 Tax=Anopheles bellator TaxID=139047 RepID=UPI002648B3E2|nr:uncharacterized protein LOC131205552 [Anopheles bellator]